MRHRLGWPQKRAHLPRLNAMVRTAAAWAGIWGVEWSVGYLTCALVGEQRDLGRRPRWRRFRATRRHSEER